LLHLGHVKAPLAIHDRLHEFCGEHTFSGTRSRCSFRRRSRHPTPAARSGGSAPMGEGTGRNTESTVFPTDESMYGALTRVVQPPRCWQREAGASQRYAR
jgi:hypothetical protein